MEYYVHKLVSNADYIVDTMVFVKINNLTKIF
jgi:hypothetical protein